MELMFNTGHFYSSPPETIDPNVFTFNTLVGFVIPASHAFATTPTLQPIYLYYSPSGVDHFISPDPLITSKFQGWANDGGSFHAYLTQQPGSVPVYEFYNGPGADHYDSTNQLEVNGIPGWNVNGIKFYAYTTQVPGTVPIYLFYSVNGVDHYQSPDPNAVNGYSGWSNYGVSFYAFP